MYFFVLMIYYWYNIQKITFFVYITHNSTTILLIFQKVIQVTEHIEPSPDTYKIFAYLSCSY